MNKILVNLYFGVISGSEAYYKIRTILEKEIVIDFEVNSGLQRIIERVVWGKITPETAEKLIDELKERAGR